MSDLDFLDLCGKLEGFQTAVRANRSACGSRFAQVLHDRLLAALDLLVQTCREGADVQRRLWIETDPAVRESLEQIFGDCLGDLETCGGGFYPWHLLDAVDRDPDCGGYHHPVAAMWCHGPILDGMTVGHEHLAGLGPILRRIADETGIRFTTYLCDTCIGPEGAGHLDPETYEHPIGNYRYQ